MLPPMWPRPTKPSLGFAFAVISVPLFDLVDVVVAQIEIGGVDDRVDRAIAQAPKPTRVISRPVEPSSTVRSRVCCMTSPFPVEDGSRQHGDHRYEHESRRPQTRRLREEP